MKRIYKLLLSVLLFIPCFVMADKTYNDGVKIANDYIYSMPEYSRYLVSSGNQKFGFDESGLKTATDFSTGGFLTKVEYERTKIKGSSWLSPGIQYWLMKDENGPLAVDLDYKRDVQESGVRVTEFVQSEARVKGRGTITTPWEFVDGYFIKVGTTDKTRGTIDTSYEHQTTSPDKSYPFILTLHGKYDVDTRECENNKNGKFKEVERSADGKTIKYEVTKVIGDFNCNINLGSGCLQLTFDDAGGSNGMASNPNTKNIYYKYGSGWYKDSSCIEPISTINKPTKTGYNFNGYKIESSNLIVVDTTMKIVAGVRETGVENGAIIKAQWDGKLSTITLNPNGGSNGTTTVYEKYGSGWYKSTTINDANKITKITIPTLVGSRFLGFYNEAGTTQYIKEDGILPSNTSFLENTTLKAKWETCAKGTYLLNNKCVACAAGTYNDKVGQNECTKCPDGYVTSGTGSTSKSACNITCTTANTRVSKEDGKCDETCATGFSLGTHTVTAGYISPQCNPNIYAVTLDPDAGSGGTTKIYEKYSKSWHSQQDATDASKITTITKPTPPQGKKFAGYYTSKNGAGTLIIDGTGKITGATTTFTSAGTLYAKYVVDEITPENIIMNHRCQNEDKTTDGTYVFTYTGACKVVKESDKNWKVYLYGDQSTRSGTHVLKFANDMKLDVFLVGGGGASGRGWGGGGGGGFTNTFSNVSVAANTDYNVHVGAGGRAGCSRSNPGAYCTQGAGGAGEATWFINSSTYKVNGGNGGNCGDHAYFGSGWGTCVGGDDDVYGGKGGSGGGTGYTNMYCTGSYAGQTLGRNKNGRATGQGYSTCEWATTSNGAGTCPSGIRYSAGGNGGCCYDCYDDYCRWLICSGGSNGAANTGNGASGYQQSQYNGGSGVMVFRNKR